MAPGAGTVAPAPSRRAAPSSAPDSQISSATPSSSDHTAYSGPEHDRALRLLQTLNSVVPAGYRLPPPPGGPEPTSTATPPPSEFQAVHEEGPFEGWTGWYYDASTDVTRDGRTGTVGVKVWTKIPAWGSNPCTLLDRLYWVHGDCTVRNVGGKRVAISQRTEQGASPTVGGFDYRADTWAAHRTPDGTVVMILQARHGFLPDTPALVSPVFSTSQLAALAVDPRFAG